MKSRPPGCNGTTAAGVASQSYLLGVGELPNPGSAPGFLFDGPEDARNRVVLAHGAGAGMQEAMLAAVAGGLAARGIRVARFEFPYMALRRSDGVRRGPDREPVLLATWRAAIAALGDPATLVIGGKSMGGRMASRVADESGVRGLVCLGYPFHPPGKPAQLRTAHLETLRTPALVVQGTRDPFGTPDEVAGYRLAPSIRVHWIEDGDHSLAPRKASGRSKQQTWAEAVDVPLLRCGGGRPGARACALGRRLAGPRSSSGAPCLANLRTLRTAPRPSSSPGGVSTRDQPFVPPYGGRNSAPDRLEQAPAPVDPSTANGGALMVTSSCSNLSVTPGRLSRPLFLVPPAARDDSSRSMMGWLAAVRCVRGLCDGFACPVNEELPEGCRNGPPGHTETTVRLSGAKNGGRFHPSCHGRAKRACFYA